MSSTSFDPAVFDRLLALSAAPGAWPSEERWRYLEAAHVVGQTRFVPHLKTHARMLALAWHTRDWPEVAGQMLRLALVPLGHTLGRLPLGNPGRSNVSAFRPFAVREDLQATINAVSKDLALARRDASERDPGGR